MIGSNFLQDLISSLIDRSTGFGGMDDPRSIEQLCVELRETTGENAIKRLGATVLEKYQYLSDEEKRAFFEFLAREMDIDGAQLSADALAYDASGDTKSFRTLMDAAEPKRQETFRRLNHVSNGTHALVDMRKDLLMMTSKNEALQRVDHDLSHLFASWFNPGFLVKNRVSWDSAASVLAKIIQYEAVHAINDWDDLRRRIQPTDRRCFAFFHPAMPHEPLVFVEVALSRGIPNSVQGLLDENRVPIAGEEADTAVFYSISNCQQGLRGISFGNSLIKQVATDLAAEYPKLSNFVTLSPVPGFSQWLESADSGLTTSQKSALKYAQTSSSFDTWSSPLRVLCARYLTQAKRPDGQPIDPVARFHLNNGASLHNIHAMADTSPNGLSLSCGVMVNYHYDLDLVESRHDGFASNGTVEMSRNVRGLLSSNLSIPVFEN